MEGRANTKIQLGSPSSGGIDSPLFRATTGGKRKIPDGGEDLPSPERDFYHKTREKKNL